MLFNNNYTMNNKINLECEYILLETLLDVYLRLSNEVYDNKISYEKLHERFIGESIFKKYVFYLVHYLRSYHGEKYYGLEINSQMKCRELWDNTYLKKEFYYIFFYDIHKYIYEICNMQGISDTKKIRIKKLSIELKHKKQKLWISQKKLSFMKNINKFLSDDLIEEIFSYFPNEDNIINFKTLNKNIKISINNTKDYYNSLGVRYDTLYCYSWKLMNIYNYRPEKNLITNYQILPYIFDHEIYFDASHGICDYCLYKIDYPRQKYLHDIVKNKLHRGNHSNFYNNWLKYQYYIICTNGRFTKRGGFISIYDRKNGYKINSYSSCKSHLVLRNNKSNWESFEKIWNKINNND